MAKSPSKRSAPIRKLKSHADLVFGRLRLANPNPRCELYFKTPFQLLVSVVLSAQTTDKSVNRCMQPLFDQGFGPADLARLGEKGFYPLIRTIGLAPTKARHLARLTTLLIERHDGQVPRTREELEALPGVGKKTASVVLAELWQEPTLAIDTHVFRVTRRLGWHDASTPEKAEPILLNIIDVKWLPAAHHWLILLGRYICQARNPLCEKCVLNDICPSSSV